MKMGLLANPKQKGYGSGIQSDTSGENMDSIGGVYLSSNFMLSYSAASVAARKKKPYADPIIVVCEIMSKSGQADEDSIRNVLRDGLEKTLTKHLGGYDWWYKKGIMDANPKLATEILNDFIIYTHKSLSKDNPNHKADVELLKEYLIVNRHID